MTAPRSSAATELGVARVVKKSKGSSGKKKTPDGTKHKSAITGRYVTKGHGKSLPKTTVYERSRKGAGRDAGDVAYVFMERYPDTFLVLSIR